MLCSVDISIVPDSTDTLDKQIHRVRVSVMVYSSVYSPCRFHCDFSGTAVSHCARFWFWCQKVERLTSIAEKNLRRKALHMPKNFFFKLIFTPLNGQWGSTILTRGNGPDVSQLN